MPSRKSLHAIRRDHYSYIKVSNLASLLGNVGCGHNLNQVDRMDDSSTQIMTLIWDLRRGQQLNKTLANGQQLGETLAKGHQQIGETLQFLVEGRTNGG